LYRYILRQKSNNTLSIRHNSIKKNKKNNNKSCKIQIFHLTGDTTLYYFSQVRLGVYKNRRNVYKTSNDVYRLS